MTGTNYEQVVAEVEAIESRMTEAKAGPVNTSNFTSLMMCVDRLLAIVKAQDKVVEPAMRAFAEQDGKDDFGGRVLKGCTDVSQAVKMFRACGAGEARFVGPLPPSDWACRAASIDRPVVLLDFGESLPGDPLRMLDMGAYGVEVYHAGSRILIREPRRAQMVAYRLEDWAKREESI